MSRRSVRHVARMLAAILLPLVAHAATPVASPRPSDPAPDLLRPPPICRDETATGVTCRLWLIESSGRQSLHELPSGELVLIHRSAGYDFVLAASGLDVAALIPDRSSLNLGPWLSDREYYLVYLASASLPAVPPQDLGEVLHRDSWTAVLETTPEDALLLHAAYSKERIFPQPLVQAPPIRPERTARKTRLEHDPSIQAMVDAVEIDEMHDVARYLQDLTTRRSDTDGARRAEQYLVRKLTEYGYEQVEAHSFNNWSDNVIAVKPGVIHPERIVILCGHYDSVSRTSEAPGADDNASGTAGVLEVARILSPYDFESTIYFMAWSGEEQGLVGSSYWAAWASSEGLQIEACVNLDMLGYLEGLEDLDIISNQESDWLRDLCFEAIPLYVPDLPLKDGHVQSGSSDHASFWANGYPAVWFFEDSRSYSPYIHTSSDVIWVSLNNFEFMRKNVQSALAMTAVLAEPYRLAIEHTPLAESPGADEPLTLRAFIRSAFALHADSLLLHYRGGLLPFRTSRLIPTGVPFEYAAELPPLPAGTLTEYYLEAVDVNGRSATHPKGAPMSSLHSFVVGLEVLYEDDFEIDRGWTIGRESDTAVSGIWVRAVPNGTTHQPDHNRTPGGAYCYVTGNAPPGAPDGAEDVDGGVTSLISPIYDLSNSSNVSLSYWRWYANEVARDDVFRVWISNDGGVRWVVLEEVERTETPWTQVRFDDIASTIPLTEGMRLLFTAEDQGLPSITEAAIDDVVWHGVRRPPFGISERIPAYQYPGEGPLSLHCRPNPATGESLIEFILGSAQFVSMLVFDVRGRVVNTLLDGVLDEGSHTHSWDGRDNEGRATPPGVYWIRVETAGGVALRQTVRIR